MSFFGSNLSFAEGLKAYDDAVSMRDQGSEGLCYAYSASYLLEYNYFRKNSVRVLLSPHSVALHYSLNPDAAGALREGGNVCEAIRSTSQSHILIDGPSVRKNITNILTKNSLSKFYTLMVGKMNDCLPRNGGTTWGCYNPSILLSYLSGSEEFPVLTKWPERGSRYYSFYEELEYRYRFAAQDTFGLTYPDFEVFYAAFSKSQYKQPKGYIPDNMSSAVVAALLKMPQFRHSQSIYIDEKTNCAEYTIDRSKSGELMKKIKIQLNLQTPVAISYCARFLHDPNYAGAKSGDYAKPGKRDLCKNHASIVTDYNKKTDEFLIRNSWGTACHYSAKHRCIDGKIWVKAELLENNTYAIHYIKKHIR